MESFFPCSAGRPLFPVRCGGIPYKVKVFIFVHNRYEVLFYIPAVTQDDDIFSVSELRHYLADHRCSQFQFGFLFLPHTVSRRYGKIVNFAFVPLGGGALNRQNTQEVLNLLTGLNETGQSILMVTRDVWAAIRGSRILYLEDGKILDELNFPAYRDEAAKDREIRLNEWLCALSW